MMNQNTRLKKKRKKKVDGVPRFQNLPQNTHYLDLSDDCGYDLLAGLSLLLLIGRSREGWREEGGGRWG